MASALDDNCVFVRVGILERLPRHDGGRAAGGCEGSRRWSDGDAEVTTASFLRPMGLQSGICCVLWRGGGGYRRLLLCGTMVANSWSSGGGLVVIGSLIRCLMGRMSLAVGATTRLLRPRRPP